MALQHLRQVPTSASRSPQDVKGLPVHRVPLRQQKSESSSSLSSPYCLAVSSITNFPANRNFLATQVWPAARVAARALETYGMISISSSPPYSNITVCELGCGPGLPSLTAAASWNCNVIATDIDDLALDLVMAAAKEQGMDSILSTRPYDLIQAKWEGDWMDSVDLFVMSDVFETDAIARGAARLTQQIFERSNSKKLWVFAQSDRAQREVYRKELKRLYPDDPLIRRGWLGIDFHIHEEWLWLCDLDETTVNYG